MNQPEMGTAVHECAHCIAAEVLGHVPTRLALHNSGPLAGECAWNGDDAPWPDQVVVACAGPLAESMFHTGEGCKIDTRTSDGQKALQLIRENHGDPAQLVRAAERLVCRHWKSIQKLAERLLIVRSLACSALWSELREVLK